MSVWTPSFVCKQPKTVNENEFESIPSFVFFFGGEQTRRYKIHNNHTHCAFIKSRHTTMKIKYQAHMFIIEILNLIINSPLWW